MDLFDNFFRSGGRTCPVRQHGQVLSSASAAGSRLSHKPAEGQAEGKNKARQLCYHSLVFYSAWPLRIVYVTVENRPPLPHFLFSGYFCINYIAL